MRVGTRGSALALVQAKAVIGLISEQLPDIHCELVEITTSGDKGISGDDKYRFVKEIDEALLAEEIDLAVHSAKDLPGELANGTRIAAALERAPATDAYVGLGNSIEEIPKGGRVGTSSLRRRSQLLAHRPDLEIIEIHGNVDTRLRKLSEGGFDGIVLATAGLKRLGRESEITFSFSEDEVVPAPGQGVVAIAARAGDTRVNEVVGGLNHAKTRSCLEIEREVAHALEADCLTPLGVYASQGDIGFTARAYVGLPDGSSWIRDDLTKSESTNMGSELARRLVGAGAKVILEAARQH